MSSSSATPKKTQTNDDRQPHFDTAVFDGLRVLFNFAVVNGHVLYFVPIIRDLPTLPFVTSGDAEPLLSFLSICLFFFMYHAVDVFLFLSGYLFGLSFCGKKLSQTNSRKNDVNENNTYTLYDVVNYTKIRFLRLLPVWLLAWLWSTLLGYAPCTTPSNIVYELFYIYTLNPGYCNEPPLGHTCMLIGWSLTTDVQAHVVMAVILFIVKTPRRASFVLVILTALTVAARAHYMLVTLGRPLEIGMSVSNSAKSLDELARFGKLLGLTAGNVEYEKNGLREFNYKMLTDVKLYVSPYMRASSAFIGYVTWYHVTTGSPTVKAMQRHTTRTLLAAVSVLLGLFSLFLTLSAVKPAPPRWIGVTHESAYRVIFTAAIAAVAVAAGSNNSCNNQATGVVRMVKLLLKNRVTKQIAKLSYAIYLMHPFLMWVATEYSPRITREQFEVWRFVPSGLMVYAATVLVAVPCHFIERCVHGGLRRWRTKAVQKTR